MGRSSVTGEPLAASPVEKPVPVHLDTAAFNIWLITISQSLIAISFQFAGEFRFMAAGHANRVWAILVLVLFWKEFLLVLLRPNWYFTGICLLALVGFAYGAGISSVAADFVLMFLPLLFFVSGRELFRRDAARVRQFFRHYLFLNLASVVFLSVPAYLMGFRLRPDYLFASGALLVIFFQAGFVRMCMSALGQAGLFALFATTKTYLIQFVAGGIFSFRWQRFLLLAGVFALVVVLSLQFGVFKQTSAYKKTRMLFSQSKVTDVSVVDDLMEGANAFKYLDVSTAQRVFELSQTIDVIGSNALSLVAGKGLGASIDVSDTRDSSVVRAFGGKGLESVRMVHLGVTYSLLKGGLIGLLLYLGFIAWVVFRALSAIFSSSGANRFWAKTAAVTAVMYVFGTLFTFSVYWKMPGLWIMLAFMASRKGR